MDLREMIRSQNDVALTLTKHVLTTKAEGDSNLVFSPLSIQVVLSAIAAGSNGSTLRQLLSFLNSNSNEYLSFFYSEIISALFADGRPFGGPRMSFSNGVWVDKSLLLKHSFEQIMNNVYKAASDQVDFQTEADLMRRQVNLWAEKETNGLIKEILPPGSVNSLTRLIFANSLYFKGVWNEKFHSLDTKDYDFFLTNGSSVKVPFMTSKNKQYIHAYNGFKVLGLPYKQGGDIRRFTMYVFLPDTNDGLKALVEKVSSDSGFLQSHLPYLQFAVGEFRIPRFKISSGFKACEVVKELGLVLPFSCHEADLTEMADFPKSHNLYVSNIFHKSFIEVNEEGTEAAAVTAAVVMQFASAAFVEDKIDFVADHPFLFMIREDVSGVLLFIGQVLNPLQN